MIISERFKTPSTVNCTIKLECGEQYNEDKLYKTCDLYYVPELGGMINPYGKNTYRVTVNTD